MTYTVTRGRLVVDRRMHHVGDTVELDAATAARLLATGQVSRVDVVPVNTDTTNDATGDDKGDGHDAGDGDDTPPPPQGPTPPTPDGPTPATPAVGEGGTRRRRS